MDTGTKKLKRHELLEWLEHDKDARQDLFDRKKGAFMQRTRERFPAVKDTSNEDLFRRVMSWIASPRCPEELARAAEVYKDTRKKTRTAQRHFNAGLKALNTSTAERDTMPTSPSQFATSIRSASRIDETTIQPPS